MQFNMNNIKIHIKAIAQVLCIWAILALTYFIIVKFIW